MQIYVTGRGVRCHVGTYKRVAGLSRKEAKFLKRRGCLDLRRETAEILIDRGWASGDPQHPLVARSFPVNDEPIPVTTQELTPDHTAETQIDPPKDDETEVLGSDAAEDDAEFSDDAGDDPGDQLDTAAPLSEDDKDETEGGQ